MRSGASRCLAMLPITSPTVWISSLGGRFSRDDVENDLLAFGIGPTCCFPGSPGFPGGPGFDFFNSFANSARPLTAADEKSTDFAPRVGLRYQVNPDVSCLRHRLKGLQGRGSQCWQQHERRRGARIQRGFRQGAVVELRVGLQDRIG